jgi:COP9 signalosome complex subunit 8
MRLSEGATGQPLAQTLFGLLASTWERKHANVYSRAENLFHLVGQTDFADGNLASLIATMTTTFIG